MLNDNRMALFPIGVVAEILKVPPRTLRIYEEEKLITPSRRGGKRFYSNRDLQWLQCLQNLLDDQGLNIASVRKLLEVVPCNVIVGCKVENPQECPGLRGKIASRKRARE